MAQAVEAVGADIEKELGLHGLREESAGPFPRTLGHVPDSSVKPLTHRAA